MGEKKKKSGGIVVVVDSSERVDVARLVGLVRARRRCRQTINSLVLMLLKCERRRRRAFDDIMKYLFDAWYLIVFNFLISLSLSWTVFSSDAAADDDADDDATEGVEDKFS